MHTLKSERYMTKIHIIQLQIYNKPNDLDDSLATEGILRIAARLSKHKTNKRAVTSLEMISNPEKA